MSYLGRSRHVEIEFRQLVQGRAEIFGFELAEGKQHLFGFECKAAVFTWKGCVIEMSFLSRTSNDAPRMVSCTLQVNHRQNMYPMTPQCELMGNCTLPSNKCAFVP
jgi:hypothetical protein